MFKKALQKHFDEMQKETTHLFEVNVDKDELWNTYLDSFPAGTNEIFRERREHDCSCCRQFIKNIGSAVTIKDNQIHTIWELNLGDTTYQPVCDALDAFVKALRKIYKIQLKQPFPMLTNYMVDIPPGGRTDALVQTVITWNHNGHTFKTRGLDADQTEAAIQATIKMLNQIESM